MGLRLRQIALIAESLTPAVDKLLETFGLSVCYRDPEVAVFGLENALMPIGHQFLEVVAPTREGTAGGRYLKRRGGDGGYMVITQTDDDHARHRAHVENLGIRIAHSFELHGMTNMQLHPADTGGAFFEIDQVTLPGSADEDGPWPPAGTDWKPHVRTERVSAIVAAELQADDPAAMARRWSEIAKIDLREGEDGVLELPLENAAVRFVPVADGRGEGLSALSLRSPNASAVLEAAERAGRRSGENECELVGMRWRLTT